jgi:alpha-glucosidase (family GH31 glycosyl hydrolase)
MRLKQRKIYLLLLLLICIVYTTAQQTFVIEAKDYYKKHNIEATQFFTGNGIKAINKNDTSWTQYKINIPVDGAYAVHVLGSLDNPVDVYNNPVQIYFPPVGNVQHHQSINVVFYEHATMWAKTASSFQLSKGEHIFTLSLAGKRQQYIERIIITSDEKFHPQGTGVQDTIKPILPPAWAFGVLYGGYTHQQKTKEVIDSLITGDFPIDAYWIDSWYWDFANKGKGPKGYMNFMEDKQAFPDVKAMFGNMQSKKIKAGVWMWNCIQREGNEAVFDSFYTKKLLRKPEINTDGWHNKTRLTINADVNFSNDTAVALWKKYLQPQFAAGLDFLKLDRNSDIDYTKAAFEASQELGQETKGRGFILNHLMMSDDPRFKLYPTKWSGDAKIAWQMPDYPEYRIPAIGALRENIMMIADPKRTTYEIPFLTHDGGGYDYFGSKDFNDELYIRWAQFSCFAPITTFFSTSNNPSRNHPYWFSTTVQQTIRKYMHLRMRLFPYIYSYAHKVRKGERFISGDGLHEQQYFFGNELLVAPVYEKGAVQRKLFLPEGNWINWETLLAYEGGKEITTDAPLDKLPLFVREGAIIPMRNYARAIELGSNDSLTIKVFPTTNNSTASFELYEDDRASNEYMQGKVALTKMTTIGFFGSEKRFTVFPVTGTYTGMKAERVYTVEIFCKQNPVSVTLNGKKVKYSHNGNFVTILFNALKSKQYKIAISTAK